MHFRELIKTITEVGQDDYPTMRHEAQKKLEALGVSFAKPKTPAYDAESAARAAASDLLNMVSSFGYINKTYVSSIVLDTLQRIAESRV